MLAVVASGAVAHALTHAMIRYRVPFLDTAAVILAPPVLLDWSRALLARLTGRSDPDPENADGGPPGFSGG